MVFYVIYVSMFPNYILRMRRQRVARPRSGWPKFLPNSCNIFFILARWHCVAIPKATLAFKLYQPSVFSFYEYYWWLLHADNSGFGFFVLKYGPFFILCCLTYLAFRKIFTYAVNSPEQLALALFVIVLIILVVFYLLVLSNKISVPSW